MMNRQAILRRMAQSAREARAYYFAGINRSLRFARAVETLRELWIEATYGNDSVRATIRAHDGRRFRAR